MMTESLPDMDEFIDKRLKNASVFPRNSYVARSGWSNLYIRVGARYIDGHKWDKIIDLANIQAEETGKGTFKKLIAHLNVTYPTAGIYVEEVVTRQFRGGLMRMGFAQCQLNPNSFFLASKEA